MTTAFMPILVTVGLGGCAMLPNVQPSAEVQVKLANPKRCLAFSGGGLRAASVSVGFAQELYRSDLYDTFDIISAASGGAWALLWLNARAAFDKGGLDAALGKINQDTEALRKLDRHTFVTPVWAAWTAVWSVILRGLGAHAAYYGVVSTKFGAPFLRETGPAHLDENVTKRKHPLPIFTATATQRCIPSKTPLPKRLSDLPIEKRLEFFRPLKKSVVEMTAYGWGNAEYWLPYDRATLDSDVEGWATISAAAPDHPHARQCDLLSGIGASYGKKVRLPKKEDLWLTDGGFADNIATYPLIRRGCSEIVVLDAEHDPTLEFEAYRRLQYDLSRSDQTEFSVPQIDDWIKTREKLGVSKTDFIVDDPNNEIVRKPAMKGTVIRPTGKRLDIIYVKLSLDPSSLPRYHHDVQSFYKEARAFTQFTPNHEGDLTQPCVRGEHTECSFPHTPTFDTNYAGKEFRAHRLLGADLARLYAVPLLQEPQK